MKKDVKRLKEVIEREKVEFLYLLFTDIAGTPKKVTIQAAQLEDALAHGVWFDGSSIEGFARICESDMLLRPDIDTFVILPWSGEAGRAAQMICDIYTPEEKPFPGDPRGCLKRTIAEAKKLGYTYQVGPEVEFFLLDEGQEPNLVPHDERGYFDLAVQSRAVKICQDTVRSLQEMGIRCESYHHEVSHGQHEIDLFYDNALRIADSILSLKQALETHASGTGLKVTFMPKPIFGINGSGMHTHQSLADKEGSNAFYSAKDEYGLSPVAYQFLAGQMKHARSLVAIVAPTVNSYKRLVPGYEAPVYICWGRINRSALIRVPQVTKSKGAAGARLELRCPDPSCNPYLAFASMLAAGLDGIKRNLRSPKAVEENVYHFDDLKLASLKIETLPTNLKEAVEEFEKDRVLTSALGEHITEYFVRAKKQEWKDFLLQVTAWEVEQYL
ncbi:type I glutamate--ammonia ligase [bacterium]|nr:type I glutamate--ammonia ligase [bacterium]